jgi:hypothetical protein
MHLLNTIKAIQKIIDPTERTLEQIKIESGQEAGVLSSFTPVPPTGAPYLAGNVWSLTAW